MVDERRSWRIAERERWRRLAAELIAASRKRGYMADLALGAASELSGMRADAVQMMDEVSIIAIDKCRGDVDSVLEGVRGQRGAMITGPPIETGTTPPPR